MRSISFAIITSGILLGGALGTRTDAGTEAGSCLESFELENFQPQSPTYGQKVSSAIYHDATTIILLLSSG